MPLLSEKIIPTLRAHFLICALSTACAISVSAQSSGNSFNTKSGTGITFRKFDISYYDTLQYLKFADRLISSYLNSSAIKKDYKCRIFVLDEKVKDDINIVFASGGVNIYLNSDFRKAENKFAIITGMINAMLLAKTGFDPCAATFSLPQWLISGIYGRLELRFFSHSILPVSSFPGLKAFCQANKLPDFRTSVFTVLTPENDGTAYELYEEFCRFLLLELKRLSSRTDNPIADLIFLTARRKYSESEIFEYTIVRAIVKEYDKICRRKDLKYNPNLLDSDTKLNRWFKETAEKRLINSNSPLPTRFFAERFYRFRQFIYIHKEKDKAVKEITVDITKLPEIYDKYGMDAGFGEMLDKKLVELDALTYVSQPLCTPHLDKLRKTLNQFEYTPDVIMKKRLVNALTEIEEALEKQQKIEDYLRKTEYTTVAPGKLYRSELLESKRLEKNFCPAINDYLDTVEKSFLKD
ncbi:MAG: hypothetical protein PHV82_00655 [Victivallaceae bacterium]|nr:hypothetical protein [Victivallaceae bacterium]